jgi:serine/threonine protein kinase
MPLPIHSRLGHYEVIARIGAGGMGEVYRARDGRLGRDVAIKVLPESFVRDAERMARFEREAKVLAALNHPHIASIYGVEDSGTADALVMELAEGPTLADRIRQSAIPLEEALPMARQIAEALEYAHERGVVHRDLKPANIKIAPDGSVKILDFGLAKAVQVEPNSCSAAESPTITQPATQTGVLLGTAAYMSPEQVRGKQVDRRAEIWAFGCVLYEMLTGSRAFQGEAAAEIMAAVLRTEPDWSRLPPATPMPVRVLLRRCLQKDPTPWLQDSFPQDRANFSPNGLYVAYVSSETRQKEVYVQNLPTCCGKVYSVTHLGGVEWCIEVRPPGMEPQTKSEPTTRTTVTFPTEIYTQLEKIAKQKKVTTAWVIREAAEKYVSDQWPLFAGTK